MEHAKLTKKGFLESNFEEAKSRLGNRALAVVVLSSFFAGLGAAVVGEKIVQFLYVFISSL